eukprot:TRINITY_DN4624_c0_g1_i2.p3 TRINITY_DN4624_c0_g1~~TRINITY_DN4624_c0_g1_i2.p3  ORF type:complete len:104 (+),score=11.22 TRINITY_DN4624_c0_g1_i2:389-700(+)
MFNNAGQNTTFGLCWMSGGICLPWTATSVAYQGTFVFTISQTWWITYGNLVSGTYQIESTMDQYNQAQMVTFSGSSASYSFSMQSGFQVKTNSKASKFSPIVQ